MLPMDSALVAVGSLQKVDEGLLKVREEKKNLKK